LLVGVRTGTGTPNLSGLYYEVGLDQDESTLLAYGFARNLDAFYGSFSAAGGNIVGHQRLLLDSFNPTGTNSTTINPSDYTYGRIGRARRDSKRPLHGRHCLRWQRSLSVA
jgi:hypothetical protein